MCQLRRTSRLEVSVSLPLVGASAESTDPQIAAGAGGGVGAGGSLGLSAGNTGLVLPLIPGSLPAPPVLGNPLAGFPGASKSIGAAIGGTTSVPGQLGSALGALSPPAIPLPGAPSVPNVPGALGGALAGLPLPSTPAIPGISLPNAGGVIPSGLPASPQLPPLNGLPLPSGLPNPAGLVGNLPLPNGLPNPAGLVPSLPIPSGLPNAAGLIPSLPIPSGLPNPLGAVGDVPSQVQGAVGGIAGGLPGVGELTGNLPAVSSLPGVPQVPVPNIAGIPAALNSAFGNIFGAGFDLVSAALAPSGDLGLPGAPSLPGAPALPGTPPLPGVPDVNGIQGLLNPASLLGLASQIFTNFFQYLSGVLGGPLSSVPGAPAVPSGLPVPALSEATSALSSAASNASLPASPLRRMRFMPRQLPDLSAVTNKMPVSLSGLTSGLPIGALTGGGLPFVGGSISLPGLSLNGNILNPSTLLSTVKGTLSNLPVVGGLLRQASGIADGVPVAGPLLSGILSGAPNLGNLLGILSGLSGGFPLPGSLSAFTSNLQGFGFKEKRDLADILALGGSGPLPDITLGGILGFVPNVGPIAGNLLPGIGSTLAGLAGGAAPAAQLLRNSPLNNLVGTVGGATSALKNVPVSQAGFICLDSQNDANNHFVGFHPRGSCISSSTCRHRSSHEYGAFHRRDLYKSAWIWLACRWTCG